MKSRRRIALTKAGTTPNRTRLQQGFATDEMGFRVKLHSSNRAARMSALGQKQTFTTSIDYLIAVVEQQ
jgi:hypothetical protein